MRAVRHLSNRKAYYHVYTDKAVSKSRLSA